MKIKINQVIKGMDFVTPLKGENEKDLTLKEVCINAVITPQKEDTEKIKLERYDIFKSLRNTNSDLVELTVEQLSLIKKSIAQCYVPLIMGQAFELLEQ